MYRIKIKETHPYNSISNRFFSIEKGQIVSVDDKFPFNPSVFDYVDEKGNVVDKHGKIILMGLLSDDEMQELLVPYELHPQFEIIEGKRVKVTDSITKFKERLASKDLSYEHILQLVEAEKKGSHRADFLDHLELVPEPKITGIDITAQTMFMNDLRTVPFVTDRAVHLIKKKFQTKENLIEALKNKNKFFEIEEYRNYFTPQFMEHLKKHYGLIKSVVTTMKHIRRRAAPKAPVAPGTTHE